jgi:short-subunit dehydrogenase involved in D-alanine esterification of teichoic acids
MQQGGGDSRSPRVSWNVTQNENSGSRSDGSNAGVRFAVHHDHGGVLRHRRGPGRRFARRGYGLAIAARRLDRLQALATRLLATGASQVITIALDVADTAAVEPAVQQAARQLGRLDIIVANAGVGYLTPTGRAKLSLMRETFDVNLVGAIATIEAALPIFHAQASARSSA